MKVVGLFRNAQRTVNTPAGTVVFQEGDRGQEMFGIVQGEIQLRTTSRVIATLGVDDIFGEMAVVDASPAWRPPWRPPTPCWRSSTGNGSCSWSRTPMFALSVMSAMANRFRAQA